MRLAATMAATAATPASLLVGLRLAVVGSNGIQRLVETCADSQCYLSSPERQLKCHS